MEFSQGVADAICERLAKPESLRSICADEAMPGMSTIMRWLGAHDAFREQYARAREAQADAVFDEILDIADDARNDFMLKMGSDGQAVAAVDHEHIARSKLRIDARKWMASKLAPKKYGDKLELSGNPEAPLVPVLNVSITRTKP